MTHRSQAQSSTVVPTHRGWWTGDVWRTALLLKRKRPDLRMLTVDAKPTGLVMITNLSPDNDSFAQGFDTHVRQMMEWNLADGGLHALHAELEVRSTAVLQQADQIGRFMEP